MHPDAQRRKLVRAIVDVRREQLWRAIKRDIERTAEAVHRDLTEFLASVAADSAPKEEPR